jgi:hypothetical protein
MRHPLLRGVLPAALRVLLLVVVSAGSLASAALAQAPEPTPTISTAPPAKQRTFPSPQAAADALTEAIRKDNDRAVAAILGAGWRDFVPGTRQDEDEQRAKFLAAWDEAHKVELKGDDKAVVAVGKTGFVLAIPIVKEADGWRYDVEAGRQEIEARYIGRNELTAVQTLLAIVDAERDYLALDPMKTGIATYARRLLSSPGQRDGLYWETRPGEPASPLGPLVAKAQAGSREEDQGYFGYHYRMLYGQGPNAPGGARRYLVHDRMIGGFAVLAWPAHYGETGVSTFMVSNSGDVYEQDLGPDTTQRAAAITVFNPDKDWQKADTTPP